MSLELINTEMKTCRICLQDEFTDELLISPCRCSGTSKYVHKLCLDTWRNTNIEADSFLKCMECNTYYQFEHGIEELKLFFYDSPIINTITYLPSLMIALVLSIIELLITNYMLIDILNLGHNNEEDYHCYKMIIYGRQGNNQTIERCSAITLKGYIRDSFILSLTFYLSFYFFIQSILFIMIHRYAMYKYTIRLKKYWSMYKVDYIIRLIYYNRFIIGYYTYVYNNEDMGAIGTYIIFLLLTNLIEGTMNVGFLKKHRKRINKLNDSREGVTI